MKRYTFILAVALVLAGAVNVSAQRTQSWLIAPPDNSSDTGTRPTCSEAYRSRVWITQASAGTDDAYQLCAKTTADTYVWIILGNGDYEFGPNGELSVTAAGIVGTVAGRFLSTGSSSGTITAATATGVTVNDVGTLKRQVYKATVATTAFVCAAVTCDVTIGTLPAKTAIVGVYADLTVPFACTATCTSATLSATLGSAAGGTQYLLSFDADAAAAQFGLADADLGASIANATAIQGGKVPAWATTSIVSMRLTSGTGNIGNATVTNLSGGSITFYLVTERLP